MTELKPQRWRALVTMEDGTESLVYVGLSTVQVRENYAYPWFDLFEKEERAKADFMSLQKWEGDPDRGRWVHQMPLAIPTKKPH